MNNVFDIRPWQTAKKCGALADPVVCDAMRRAQKEGRSGNEALWNTYDERRRLRPMPPGVRS